MAAVLDTPWSGQNFVPPTALDITTIEASIVDRLGAQVKAIEIVHFPDRPEAYRMTHRVGAALVSYRGSTYGGIIDTEAVVQERKLEFEVRVLARDLGWAYGGARSGAGPGAYGLLEAIRAALTGFQIPGCRKAYPLRERFIERDNQGGVWVYAISFVVETLALEAAPQDNLPLFIKGVARESGGSTTIVAGALLATFDPNGTIALPSGNVSGVIVAAPGGARYIEGADYEVDSVNGIITLTPAGAINPGTTVEIAYSYADTVVATSGQSAPLKLSAI